MPKVIATIVRTRPGAENHPCARSVHPAGRGESSTSEICAPGRVRRTIRVRDLCTRPGAENHPCPRSVHPAGCGEPSMSAKQGRKRRDFSWDKTRLRILEVRTNLRATDFGAVDPFIGPGKLIENPLLTLLGGHAIANANAAGLNKKQLIPSTGSWHTY